MELSITIIVSILGIIMALFFGYRSKIKGYIKNMRQAHTDTQNVVKEKVEETKSEIVQKQKEYKVLEEKSKKAEEVIAALVASSNDEVQKILKEKNVDTLIKEFNKW